MLEFVLYWCSTLFMGAVLLVLIAFWIFVLWYVVMEIYLTFFTDRDNEEKNIDRMREAYYRESE